jgi:DNA-binding LytR/AlgR family response regulator
MAAEKINILIVEDESIVAMDLSAGLMHSGYHVTGIADNAVDARDLFEQNDVDIVLMDINLIGEKDGVDTVVDLMKIKQRPVIYLTAFTDTTTVERVKRTFPAAFLTKPYSIANVRIAIDLALNNFAALKEEQQAGAAADAPTQRGSSADASAQPGSSAEASAQAGKVISMQPDMVEPSRAATTDKDTILQINDYIFIKQNYQFVKVKITDILYVESDNNYVRIITSGGLYVLRVSLNQLLEKIIFQQLVRIHRSYAVNIHAVKSFTEQDVLVGDKELPIGKNYKETFLKRFNFH